MTTNDNNNKNNGILAGKLCFQFNSATKNGQIVEK